MSEVNEAQLQELIEKREQAKVLFLKYTGAVEALQSILSQPKPEKKSKKESKAKK
jgi:hypothetical protein